MIYIFCSLANREEAKKIIEALLQKRLIACASILSEVESIYRWKGKIEYAKEVKVLLKTRRALFEKIDSYIRKVCSYEVPEIVQVNMERASKAYLKWILKETRGK